MSAHLILFIPFISKQILVAKFLFFGSFEPVTVVEEKREAGKDLARDACRWFS